MPIEARLEGSLQHRYLQALVQWAYRDPSIELVVREQIEARVRIQPAPFHE